MADKKEKEERLISQRLAQQVAETAGKAKYPVIAAIALIIVAIIVIALVRRSNEATRIASENALYKAQIDAYTKLDGDPQSILGEVVGRYPGTPAAAQASIYQFAFAVRDGQAETAEKIARDFIAKNSRHEFVPRMRLALGQLLLDNDRVGDARREIEPLSRQPGATMPEALLTMAQIYEREAEPLKDEPAAYEQKLIEARDAYTNIVAQAQNRQAFWPPSVVLAADFSLLLVNDKLAGYSHPAPKGAPASAAAPGSEALDVSIIPAPPSDTAAPREPAEPPAAGEAPETPEGDGEAGE